MKRKLIGILLATTMATSFVGCQVANIPGIGQNSSDFCVTVGRSYHTGTNSPDKNETDVKYYTEFPSIGSTFSGGNIEKFLTDEYYEASDLVYDANAEIMSELSSYNEVYTEPTDVKLTGEIKDDKMYFYYDGYVTTLDGVTEDYNKVIVCDLKFDTKVLNFELDKESDFDVQKFEETISSFND